MCKINFNKHRQFLILSVHIFTILLCLYSQAFSQKSDDEKVLKIETYEGNEVAKGQGLLEMPRSFTAKEIARIKTFFAEKEQNFPISIKKISKKDESSEKNIYLFRSTTGGDTKKLFEVFSRFLEKTPPRVEIKSQLEPDLIVRGDSMNGMFTTNGLWGLNRVQAEKVWAQYKIDGSKDLIVAVLDSGMFAANPALGANVWRADKEYNVPLPIKKCPKGSYGVNFWGNSKSTIQTLCQPKDLESHGSSVSGIIGALKNNIVGGVTQKINMMQLKVLNKELYGPVSKIIEGIEFVIGIKSQLEQDGKYLRIVNASIFVNPKGDVAQNLKTAVEKAESNGLLVVFAAGNDGTDITANTFYSKSVNSIITVSASSMNEMIAGGSNFSDGIVHLAAPGETINSTSAFSSEPYQSFGQTSAAAPFVSGSAALIMAVCPELTNAQIKKVILEGSDMTHPAITDHVRYGRLDVLSAIKKAEQVYEGKCLKK